MGMVKYRVRVNLGSWKRFQKAVHSNSGEIRKAYGDWSKYYASFIRKRFIRASKGGGGWKHLAPSTIARKRAKGSRYWRRILMDTGKMYKVLDPRLLRSTARTRKKKTGITVTYGSRRKYRKGPLVSDVMRWHHNGYGSVPRRRIFINPDRRTLRKMAERMDKAFQKELDE